jgi:hypothetical protein
MGVRTRAKRAAERSTQELPSSFLEGAAMGVSAARLQRKNFQRVVRKLQLQALG